MFTADHTNITGSIHSCYYTHIVRAGNARVFLIQSMVLVTVGRT